MNEAYMKGRGKGLARSPEQLAIDLDAQGLPIASVNWQIALHRPTGGHIAATAIRAGANSTMVPVQWRTGDKLILEAT